MTRDELAAIVARDEAWSDNRQSPDSVSPSADRRALLALLRAVAAGRVEMKRRYDDLRWCNKPDLCNEKAEGAALAIEDFDDALGVAAAALAALGPP